MRNPKLLLANAAARWTLFPIPIVILYMKDHLGMSLTEVMLIQGLFSAFVTVLEFPTGYVADRIGYRPALVLASVFFALGWLGWTTARGVWDLPLIEFLLACGVAFMSGSDSALMYDSLKTAGRDGEYTLWEARLRATNQTAESVSTLFSGWLYTLNPKLPFFLQLPFQALAVLIALLLKDRPRHGERIASHLDHAWNVVKTTLTTRGLRSAVFLGIALSMASFLMVWIIQPYMQGAGVPELWFGPIWCAANLWVAFVNLQTARLERRFGAVALLAACVVFVAAGYGLLALTGDWWGFVFYFFLLTQRGLQNPVLISEIQRHAPDEDRAAVLSVKSMIFRLLFAGFGPGVGLAADAFGLRAAIGLAGLLITLAAAATLRLYVWERR